MDLSQQVSIGMLTIILVAMVLTTALKLYSKFKESTCSCSSCCSFKVETNDTTVDPSVNINKSSV